MYLNRIYIHHKNLHFSENVFNEKTKKPLEINLKSFGFCGKTSYHHKKSLNSIKNVFKKPCNLQKSLTLIKKCNRLIKKSLNFYENAFEKNQIIKKNHNSL
jgi:hypothetical protein